MGAPDRFACRSPCSWLFADASALLSGQVPEAARGALQAIAGGSLTGMVIRGLYPASTAAALLAQFDEERVAPPTMLSPFFPGRAWGRPLTVERDFEAYLTTSPQLQAIAARACDAVGCQPLDALFEALVAALDDGARVRVAATADGRPYVRWTLREVKPTGRIPLHYEDEAFELPAMQAYCEPLLAERHHMSAYLVLQHPQTGGELRVYDLLGTEGPSKQIQLLPRDADVATAALEAVSDWAVPQAQPGDLLVFDAGRRWHEVRRVGGERARWTMGMFFGKSRDGGWIYWA